MATRVLLTYHTEEGQTARIADRIAMVLRGSGAHVVVARADDDPSPTPFDLVIAGDSIHIGRHSRSLVSWLGRHGDELDEMPVAIFQVSLTSASADDAHVAESHRLLQQLLDATGVDPDIVGMFAGSLAYTRYGWLKRRMLVKIAAAQGAPTDTGSDHEFTDWAAVGQFAGDSLAMVDPAAAPVTLGQL